MMGISILGGIFFGEPEIQAGDFAIGEDGQDIFEPGTWCSLKN
jgi:hypothetical protein